MDEDEKLRRRQRSNVIVAKFIPAFLTAIVVYASYVFVGPLCVNYLINPPSNAAVQKRFAIGIALPLVYLFLLLLMASCYLRLVLIVSFDPGYIPQQSTPKDVLEKPAPTTDRATCKSCAPTHVVEGQELVQLEYDGILRHGVPAPPGLQEFYQKDAFVCDRNGLPLWCHTCGNWKADRVHHSRDVGRCVKKMDHFCPWVGGMVGENCYKFFIQFNIYAAVFSLYTMIVMAVFVAEAERKTGTVGDVQWVVVLGLGGFFAIFTFGLALTSMHLVLQNVSTVENIDMAGRTMYIAVLLPPELQRQSALPPPSEQSSRGGSEMPLHSEIDDPAHQSYFSSERPSRSRRRSRDELTASIWQGSITYPLQAEDKADRRTFAILKTVPGTNPWNLGPLHNFYSVFGMTLHEWLLPYSRSPCTNHSSGISRYPFGWEFEQLLSDAQLIAPPEFVKNMVNGTSKQKRKKRRLPEGWQNGERPDAWILEKEARRIRREQRESRSALPI